MRVVTFIIPEIKKKEAKLMHSNIKVMLSFSFSPMECCIIGTQHKAKSLLRSTTWSLLICDLHDAEWCKQTNPWTMKTWLLHHNNTPAHSSHLIHTFLVEHNIPLISQRLPKHDGSDVMHSQRRHPKMFLTMMGEVCTVPRGILWSALGFQTSSWEIVFFPAKCLILF